MTLLLLYNSAEAPVSGGNAILVGADMFLGLWQLGEWITFPVCIRDTNGADTDSDAPPTYAVYEDETVAPIVTGTMAKLGAITGFYTERLELASASGFEKNRSYTIRVAATVGGTPASGVHVLQLGGRDPWAIDLPGAYADPQAGFLVGTTIPGLAGQASADAQVAANRVSISTTYLVDVFERALRGLPVQKVTPDAYTLNGGTVSGDLADVAYAEGPFAVGQTFIVTTAANAAEVVFQFTLPSAEAVPTALVTTLRCISTGGIPLPDISAYNNDTAGWDMLDDAAYDGHPFVYDQFETAVYPLLGAHVNGSQKVLIRIRHLGVDDGSTLEIDLAAVAFVADTGGAGVAAPTVAEIDAQLSGTHGAGLWTCDEDGQFSVVYTALVDGLPASGVYCRLTSDAAGLVPISAGTSDAAGHVTFHHNLPSGTPVYVWRFRAGVAFSDPDPEQIP